MSLEKEVMSRFGRRDLRWGEEGRRKRQDERRRTRDKTTDNEMTLTPSESLEKGKGDKEGRD